MKRRILIATVASGALLLAACGSDDADGDDATGTTLSVEDARAKAESALLRLEDLPAGYTQSADDEDEDDTPSPEGCEYMDEFEDLPNETEAEVSFEIPDGFTEIDHTVSYADEETTQRNLDVWKDERTAECVERLFTDGFSAEDQDFELESAGVTATEGTVDSQGYQGSVVISADGEELAIEFRVELRRAGPLISMVGVITTIGAPVDFDAINEAANARIDAVA
jgi:predicted small secreted protein